MSTILNLGIIFFTALMVVGALLLFVVVATGEDE